MEGVKSFGVRGQAIADALTRFSFDVIGIVARYALFPGPVKDTQPVLETSRDVREHLVSIRESLYFCAVGPDNLIWAGTGSCVIIFNPDLTFHSRLNLAKDQSPNAITFGGNKVFVATTSRSWSWGTNPRASIAIFDTSCRELRPPLDHYVDHFGSANAFDSGIDISADESLLFVASPNVRNIIALKPDGTLVRQFGGMVLGQAKGICVSPSGEVVVADESQQCIQVFAKDGSFLRSFACSLNRASFRSMCPVSVDHFGNVLCRDWRGFNVFSPGGESITRVWHPSMTSITCDDEGRFIGCSSTTLFVYAFVDGQTESDGSAAERDGADSLAGETDSHSSYEADVGGWFRVNGLDS